MKKTGLSIAQYITRFCGLFLMLTASVSMADNQTTLKLGATEWPPFTATDSQANFATELVTEAFKRAGISTTTQLLPWSDVLNQLKNRQLQGVVTLWKTGKPLPHLLYSRAYLENRIKLAALSSTVAKQKPITALSQLQGKRIGLVADYAYGQSITQNTNNSAVYSANDASNVAKLIKGEVDYILIDELTAKYLFSKMNTDDADKPLVLD
jgi:ABC-type amino acid transport substrate-binding protein